jgi:NAD(P)H-hydrate epimerase
MTLPLADTGSGHLAEKALERLLAAAEGFDCVALGPGLGRDHESAALVTQFLAKSKAPVVLDADGLNAIAGRLATLKRRPAATVLTPHAGELARLLGTDAAEVETHRLASVKAAAKKSGAIIVLKGSATIITDGRETVLSPAGNPGLATAGAGDVLTGIIAALMAKGLRPFDAAAAGAFIHGLAADRAGGDTGEDNLVSSDLIDYLPPTFTSLQEEE